MYIIYSEYWEVGDSQTQVASPPCSRSKSLYDIRLKAGKFTANAWQRRSTQIPCRYHLKIHLKDQWVLN